MKRICVPPMAAWHGEVTDIGSPYRYWNCDEASGNLIDEIASLGLVPENDALHGETGIINDCVKTKASHVDCFTRTGTSPYLMPSGDFSISFWIKAPAGETDDLGVLRIYRASPSLIHFLKISISDLNIRWYCSGLNYSSAPIPSFALDTWHHVCVCRSSGVHQFFFNGTRLTPTVSYNDSTDYGSVGQVFFFGFANSESGECYLDELAIFDKVLNLAEVNFLHNGGSGRAYPW